jgi:CubicO group peptidase (beta-lactamase class C family)
MTTRALTAALVLVCLAGGPAGAERPDPARALAGLDTLIQQALEEQKIPGASVGVVVGGEVVLLQGYGYRDVERRLPMTPDTMIPIASVTKQFTVASLGTLVRQGTLEWDTPVREYLPDFRLHDDYATLRATPRDLVTHRTGLPRHDFAWFGSALSREDLYRQLRNYTFSRDIRTRFQYNNFMYMTAGYLAGRVAGSSYEDHVRASLLEPLGMSRTNFSLATVIADADHATAYQLDNARRPVTDRFESAEQMSPTGGMNSTARDLVKWLRMMLAGGELEGTRILQASDVKAMMQPQMPVGEAPFPEIGFRSYGMGLFVESYRGYEVAQHGGNMPGAATMVLMLPREGIGVVVLANRSGARLRDGLPYEIVDRLLGLESAGMVARTAELERKAWAGEDAARSAGTSGRRQGTRPSRALEEYAGRYASPGYGPVDIAVADDALRLTYHGFTTTMEHWHYDVFRGVEDRTSRLDRVRVQFQTDLAGEVSGVAVPMESAVAPILFAKQPPAEMTERGFLERFVGAYELGGIEVQVALRDDGVLQFVQLGRAAPLVPVRGTLFRHAELEGVTLEFLSDAAGRVDRMAVHANGSAIAPRKR